ncbi:hypothetical protein IQ07DRAFT_652131, partial [Pyrenochaeta sp. DS3sAY3a]
LFLVKRFKLYSFQLQDPKEPCISIYCHYLPESGLGNLNPIRAYQRPERRGFKPRPCTWLHENSGALVGHATWSRTYRCSKFSNRQKKQRRKHCQSSSNTTNWVGTVGTKPPNTRIGTIGIKARINTTQRRYRVLLGQTSKTLPISFQDHKPIQGV